MIVEDNQPLRELAVRYLKELGYQVSEASDSARALSLLQAGAPVDLLFTDVSMPGLDGYALAAAAKKLRPALKVLLTSGFTNLAAAGGDEPRVLDLLSKPYRKEELALRVRTLLHEA